MRKTRFFYSLKFALLILLAWMLLLEEAVRLNLSQETASQRKPRSEKMEIQRNSQSNETAEAKKLQFEEKDVQRESRTEETKAENEPQSRETAAESAQEERKVRVLLMDTGYQSYFHPFVTVAYQGEEFTYTASGAETEEFPIMIPEQEEGIQICSIERQQGLPIYQGSLEIRNTSDGLLLINELPLETYLESVVPSEMPSSYESEALKAQAVCARTYACKQIQEARLEEYGADVDDSVRFQVYGNISSQESTTKAVMETAGQVLCQRGELIQAYYFSTSSGATSTDEIWGAEEAASYLKAVPCQFDQNEPWSSWNVTIPWDTLLQRAVNKMPEMEASAADSTNFDSTVSLQQEGSTALKALEIFRKNQSNAVTGLRVITEEGSFDLTEEYAIREFLSPIGCTVTEKDGTEVQGGSLLPSAYFTMEVNPGVSVLIQGRGYGHGVGMSQNAANQMAAQGYRYPEILNYFFNDVEIQQVDTKADS